MLTFVKRAFSYRPPQIPIPQPIICKSDTVQVISGKDKGKQGKVLRVDRKDNAVLVEGVNFKVKHFAADAVGIGRKEQVTRPIHISNVALIDPETNKPTRIKLGFLEDGTKVRVSKKSGALIPKLQDIHAAINERHAKKDDGYKDTLSDLVLTRTYFGEDLAAIKEKFDRYIEDKAKEAAHLVFPE